MINSTRNRPSIVLALVLAVVVPAAATIIHGQVAAPKAPMTDQAYAATMKQIDSTFRSLRINNKAMNHTDGERDALRLARWFGDVERYWEAKRVKDAVDEARTAIKAAEEIAAASKAMNMSTLESNEKTLASTCESCHKAHREMLADGTFRIR
jgi:hypothetical protein